MLAQRRVYAQTWGKTLVKSALLGMAYGVVLTFADFGVVLPDLDALEGLHLTPPEYERVLVSAQPSGETVWTYVYVNQIRLTGAGVTPVAGGNWPHLG